jgi:6-carboxyhexanoate--CoA ligase
MWNIRMRASKQGRDANKHICRSSKAELKIKDIGVVETHISGAEGIYSDKERSKIIKEYCDRALTHPKGEPDRIVITVEKIRQKPKMVKALSVTTLKCHAPSEAKKYIRQLLDLIGISGIAIENGLKVLAGNKTMRGASLITSETGRRIESDRERGVRASSLGITTTAGRALSVRLKREGLDNTTVKEAIILASKVASCRQVMAELCVSDDPDYTTGYIASKRLGYVRIPNIKVKGSNKGGRVFFVYEDANLDTIIKFMEKTPLMINSASECCGTKSINEIVDCYYR